MIKCSGCEYTSRNNSGMAMHLRTKHPDLWKGNIKNSFPEGYDSGTAEPRKKPVKGAFAEKGEKKTPIPQNCPWCDYSSIHPPGLAHHIKGAHPKKWKGRLSVSLGRKKTKSDEYLDRRKKEKKNLTHSEKWIATRKKNLEASNGKQEREPRKFINNCPNCGHNLIPYYLAAGIDVNP